MGEKVHVEATPVVEPGFYGSAARVIIESPNGQQRAFELTPEKAATTLWSVGKVSLWVVAAVFGAGFVVGRISAGER